MKTTAEGLPAELEVIERGWLSANNIVFRGRDQTAVVDTGYVTHAAQTVALIELALAGRPLDLVLNTHLHSDHCGGNAALRRRYPDARTLIPPGESAAVRDWDSAALSFDATGELCERFGFDGLLEPGREIVLGDRPWQIHAARGHDPHSIVLFEPRSKTLLSADALWENGFGVVFPELHGGDAFDEVAATLDMIEQLAPLHVVPGHGGIFHDCAGALVKARRRLQGFQQDPLKHARHGFKVLLKFKLMELQTWPLEDLLEWVRKTPYAGQIQRRFFAASTLEELSKEIIAELAAVGAAKVDGAKILNS
ncbi:MBL fold metallo-hydrolase [Variovorax sp. J22P168]|uniref:MBL fold metallo-hydrolase n=1 Tax=Variovorax jilinensis TaxID=3053513 RepID=UPI002574B250|nr:MBL fold metallo-hydrolase [Variovorax sp. J22P168]MDM0012250.1 MBL fold metallo-hydrolase [Variovorax sp. J22P168]